MKSIRFILAGIVMVASLPLYAHTSNNKLVIEGSTTVLPIAQAAAESFMDKTPGANIVVRGGGSGVGITSLIEGTCDIADSSRAIKDAELQKAAGKGHNVKAHVVAMDGIAVIVNPGNGLQALSRQQIKDIYTGKISNWKQLGLSDEQIVVVSRDTASGTYEAFGLLALDNQKVRRDALLQASNQAIASVVAKTGGAIGYVGMGYLGSSVKAVTVNGVAPTTKTVLSAKYPLSRPLYMYTNGEAKGLARDFIDYILSPEGQKLVEREGFVALK